MNTNSKAFRAHVRAHLLGAVYDYAGEDSDPGRARHMWAMFMHGGNYEKNRRRIPNTQARVADWLAGLPLQIAFANHEILALSEAWHGAPHSDAQADRVVANWFNMLAMHLMRLWSEAGIDPHDPDWQGCATRYTCDA